MKRLTKVILWGLVLALLLTACGGAAENTPPVENTHTDIVADNTFVYNKMLHDVAPSESVDFCYVLLYIIYVESSTEKC